MNLGELTVISLGGKVVVLGGVITTSGGRNQGGQEGREISEVLGGLVSGKLDCLLRQLKDVDGTELQYIQYINHCTAYTVYTLLINILSL